MASPLSSTQELLDHESDHLDEESSSATEGPSTRCKHIAIGVAVFSVIVLGLTLLFFFRSSEPECLGFDKCPSYPLPYDFGAWPTLYEYSGTFPDDFIWGVGTASYQVEGAYREGGRGASIWDTFTGADTVGMPGANCSYCCKVAPCPMNKAMSAKGASGNVACDHYHKMEADVALMKSMGLKHYRFSIAWPRIFPTGKKIDGINIEGVAFYNKLIDALLAAGITPYVTLYHWDLPQGLLDPPQLQAWWSRDATGAPNGQIIPDWLDYVDACFAHFGDRVKMWITFNEVWSIIMLASGWGKAPNLPEFSNMSIDPYIAGHNILNAHAAAVDLYRIKYQNDQKGKIGITNNCDWREPKSKEPVDIAAAERALEFRLAWFTDPIFGGTGDYPQTMRRLMGSRLPKFTESQKRLLNGSADFFGLNHYGSGWAGHTPGKPQADYTYSDLIEDGLPRGQSGWLYGAGWGLRKLLNWIDRRYEHPPILITESGWSLAADTAEEGVADGERVAYYANYTAEMHKAIVEDGVDVRGYFAWSFIDNFEWEMGYGERFGIVYTDYALGFDKNASTNNDQQPTPGKQMRIRKTSSCWLEAVWSTNVLVDPNSASFKGCVNLSVFAAHFLDPEHPKCMHVITLEDNSDKGMIKSDPAICRLGSQPIVVGGGTIVADFSSRNGPSNLVGYWNSANQSIEWGDGKTWAARFE